MERFFRVFHKRSNRTLDTRPRFENGYPAEDAFSLLYPPSVVNEMDRLLEHAEATAKSDRAKGWLKTTRDAFDGLKAISEMFVAKRAYEMQPTREMLQMVKQRVDAFEEWRLRIVHYSTDKAYVRDWFPGYYRLCSNLICAGDGYWWNHYFYHLDVLQADLQKVLKGEKKMRGTGVGPGTILAPLTWDFDKMMAGVGKPREEKVACVKRTAAKPGADGALDPKAWADAQPYLFEMYHAANSSVDKDKQTFVRLLYDDAHIYVRFECYEPRIGDMKLKSVGKDGDVYHQDEVELFLNPECSNRKFLHFMAAPVADAAYDERKGYFEDPLDPRYHIADVSWNAEWSYTYSIDRERNLWVVEMSVPFKSLGQSSPRPGTVWTGNFARARRAHGGEELSCWVAEEFGNPEVFGEITFGPEAVRPGQ
jgi:hypothetical protein